MANYLTLVGLLYSFIFFCLLCGLSFSIPAPKNVNYRLETVVGEYVYGPSNLANLNNPQGMHYDNNRFVYIADYGSNRIVRWDTVEDMITLFAGNSKGQYGYSGDGGLATDAMLNNPSGVCVTSSFFYIVDAGNKAIRRVDKTSLIITTVLSNLTSISACNGYVNEISYIDNNAIYTFSESTNQVNLFAGKPGISGSSSGDNGPATSATFYSLTSLKYSADGSALFISEKFCIRKIKSGTISTFSGKCGSASALSKPSAGTPGTKTYTSNIFDFFFVNSTLYVVDFSSFMSLAETTLTITTIVVSSVSDCYCINTIKAAPVGYVSSMFMKDGKIYFSSPYCHGILSATKPMQRVVGGILDDNTIPEIISFDINGIAVWENQLYFADRYNNRIRMLSLSTKEKRTILEMQNKFACDSGTYYENIDASNYTTTPVLQSGSGGITQLAVLTNGDVLFVDIAGKPIIRKIDATSKKVSTFSLPIDSTVGTSTDLYRLSLCKDGRLFAGLQTIFYVTPPYSTNQTILSIGISSLNSQYESIGGVYPKATQPISIAGSVICVDSDLYYPDQFGIYKVNSSGIITKLKSVTSGNGIASDKFGAIYVGEESSNIMYKYFKGEWSVFAGTIGSETKIDRLSPRSIVVDDSNNIYYSEGRFVKRIVPYCDPPFVLNDVNATCVYGCFSVLPTSKSVCSGHGSCIDLESCVCSTGYSGLECEIYYCSSILYNSTAVCSGKGNCISSETCYCPTSFGSNCETERCFGVFNNSTSVCSGHGYCIGLDKCSCQDGWTGDNCNLFSCYGIPSSNLTSCSGNGQCISNNTCHCSDGWINKNCSETTCYSISSFDTNVCNGHGNCVSKDTCQCNTGWYGYNCSIHSCYSKLANDSMVCSGNGKCALIDTCECNQGWFENNCSIPSCFGLRNEDSKVCSGNGKCTFIDTCECNQGWYEDNCSLPSCFELKGDDVMVCSSHGTCQSLDLCECNQGWYGYNCSIPSCFGLISNDSKACSSHGNCTFVDSCECNQGWYGNNCSIPSCYSKLANDSMVCSGNGKCTFIDTCECNQGWYGNNCSLPSCFSKLADDTSVCSGNGNCTHLDECKCNQGWASINCNITSCFGVSSESENVCSGNGYCIDIDTCHCSNNYWYGLNCNITTCFGILSDSNNVCSSNGICNSIDSCVCYNGYQGLNCSEFTCYNLSYLNISVCSGNGKCESKDNCTCNEGYFGLNCQNTISNITTNNSTELNSTISNNSTQLPNITTNTNSSIIINNSTILSSNSTTITNVTEYNNTLINNTNNSTELNSTISNNSTQLPNITNSSIINNSTVSSSSNSTTASNVTEVNNTTVNTTKHSCYGVYYDSPTACYGNGLCISENTCDCNQGWYGYNCSIPSCFELLSNDTMVCSSHGKCESKDNCICNEGYFGLKCQNIISNITTNNSTELNSTISNNSTQFNDTIINNSTISNSNSTQLPNTTINTNTTIINNSTVSSSSNSTTITNVTEFNNSTTTANTTIISNTTLSNNNNSTTASNVTEVNNTTVNTTKHSCYGEYYDSPTVCSRNGKCESKDNCTCNSSYFGNKCQYLQNPSTKCFNILSTNETVCSGNGLCISENTCECNFGFKGSECNSCIENYYGKECKTKYYGPAIYGTNGNSLEFKLFTTEKYQNNFVNCKDFILNNQLFGTNPLCYWIDKLNGIFIIELDGNSIITLNDTFSINLNYFDSNIKLFKELEIIPSPNLMKPIVKLQYKSLYSICEDVIIDGSESFSGDFKPLNYYWNVEGITSNNFLIKNNLIYQNDLKSILKFNNTNLIGNFNFSLIVESSFTRIKSDKYFINFEISNIPNPTIIFLNSKAEIENIEINTVPIIIKKDVEFPSCYYSNKEMIYKWTQNNGPLLEYYIDKNNNLVITKFLYSGEYEYIFSLQVISKFNSNSNSTRNITIKTISQPLFLNLYTTQLTLSRVSIEIDFSDPDFTNENETFYWNCISGCDANNLNILHESSLLKLTNFELTKTISNVINFELQISKGLRSITKSLTINFPKSISTIPPIINLISVSPNRFKVVKDETFSISFSVVMDGDINLVNDQFIIREWTLNNQIIPNQMTSLMALPPSQSNYLIIPISDLNEDVIYSLNFKVTDTRNSLYANYAYQFKVVKSPKSCTCNVSPLIGYAFETSFSFSCPNCQNLEQSIDFKFGFIDDKSNAQLPLYNLGETFSTYFPMPVSSNTLNSYISIVDTATGASVELNIPLTIKVPSVKTLTDVKKKVKLWQSFANSLSSTDTAKLVFNSATITRTSELMVSSLNSPPTRSIDSVSSLLSNCNQGMWNSTTGKCDCFEGFKSASCNLNENDYSSIMEMRTSLVDSMMLSIENRNENENLPTNHFSVYMYGLDGITSKTISTFDLPFPKIFNISKVIFAKAILNQKLVMENGVDTLIKYFMESCNKMINFDKLERKYGIELFSLFKNFSILLRRSFISGQKDVIIETDFANFTLSLFYKNQATSKTIQTSQDGITIVNVDPIRKSLVCSFISITDIIGIGYQLNPPFTITHNHSPTNQTIEFYSQKLVSNILFTEKSFDSDLVFNFNNISPTLSEIIIEETDELKTTKSITSSLICRAITNYELNSSIPCNLAKYNSSYYTCTCSDRVDSVVLLESVTIITNINRISLFPDDIVQIAALAINSQIYLLLFLLFCIPIVLLVVLFCYFKCKSKRSANRPVPELILEEHVSGISEIIEEDVDLEIKQVYY